MGAKHPCLELTTSLDLLFQGISDKVKTHAFSGGRMTAKEQRELGADLDKDVSYQWLRFFLEDDNELEAIGASYGSGQGESWCTKS